MTTNSASQYPEMVQVGSKIILNDVEWKIASVIGEFAILSSETMLGGRKDVTVSLQKLLELQRFRTTQAGFNETKVN